MKNRIFPVKRDEIYAGQVITDFELDSDNREFKSFYVCRSILFTIDSDGKAIDLLYSSPSYPIYNVSDINKCLHSNIIIKYAKNIGPLLKYFGYDEYLDYKDVLSVRKKIFSKNFAHENSEIFGLSKNQPKLDYYDTEGKLITNPQTKEKLSETAKIRYGYDTYTYTESSIYDGISAQDLNLVTLSAEYFNLLITLKNPYFIEYLKGSNISMNAFKPHNIEGPIRSLKKVQ